MVGSKGIDDKIFEVHGVLLKRGYYVGIQKDYSRNLVITSVSRYSSSATHTRYFTYKEFLETNVETLINKITRNV